MNKFTIEIEYPNGSFSTGSERQVILSRIQYEILTGFFDGCKASLVVSPSEYEKRLKNFITSLDEQECDWRASQKSLAESLLEVFEEREFKAIS